MNTLFRFAFALSLLVFGLTASAGLAPASDDLVPACDGDTTILCSEERVERCLKWVPCGYVFPFFLKVCCKEDETTVEYFYYPEGSSGTIHN